MLGEETVGVGMPSREIPTHCTIVLSEKGDGTASQASVEAVEVPD